MGPTGHQARAAALDSLVPIVHIVIHLTQGQYLLLSDKLSCSQQV